MQQGLVLAFGNILNAAPVVAGVSDVMHGVKRGVLCGLATPEGSSCLRRPTSVCPVSLVWDAR